MTTTASSLRPAQPSGILWSSARLAPDRSLTGPTYDAGGRLSQGAVYVCDIVSKPKPDSLRSRVERSTRNILCPQAPPIIHHRVERTNQPTSTAWLV